jgi:O-succinylbenzoate synthase
MAELMATDVRKERFVEEENATSDEAQAPDVLNEEMISEQVLHFAQRVDQSLRNPIGVGEEPCAGRADRTQPEADIESLRFL